MFSPLSYVLLWTFPIIITSGIFAVDVQPYLTLYSPGEPEYTDVLVKRVGDNLTLTCELKGDTTPRVYFWNYMPNDNASEGEGPLMSEQRGTALASRLWRPELRLNDSGHYVCSSPPFSVSKFILVQTKGPRQCARGAFWCGKHCVLASYVCDGFKDCVRGEDEAPELCMHQPCARPDKLNCSSGRCVSAWACCRPGAALCRQPACCEEHPPYTRLDGFVSEAEYPLLFEDRHAPDEYGFIQSTIYTVTACALIFMIAVVLLVSAICKMHMKRAALREYTQTEYSTRLHYEYAQTHRFPPCYEASRLLEQQRTASPPASPPASQPASPASPARNPLQCTTECEDDPPECADQPPRDPISRLTNMFSRYRQVPTQCLDVEMTDVRSFSCNSSPTRNRTRPRLDHYRSPTYCDLNSDLFFNSEVSNCGRDLNYMATPMEFYRRRTLRNNLERVIDQINRPRPITLQLGRFQLSIPRLGRRQSLDRRPDTPNVAELNIEDLDFVRLNSNDTYTLNGRTIRLLGANFENYPVLDPNVRPPPYNEAMRYKLFGPPPEYLSRDGLNGERETTVTEEQARQNIEMPPCYDDVNVTNGNNVVTVIAVTESLTDSDNETDRNAASDLRNGNAGDIQSNAGEIQSNTGEIQSNTGEIQSNAGAIQSNAGEIQSNAGDSQSNTGNLQSNTGDLQSNGNLQSDIQSSGILQSIGNTQSIGEAQSVSNTQIFGLSQSNGYLPSDIQSSGILQSIGNTQSIGEAQSAGNTQNFGLSQNNGNYQKTDHVQSNGNLQSDIQSADSSPNYRTLQSINVQGIGVAQGGTQNSGLTQSNGCKNTVSSDSQSNNQVTTSSQNSGILQNNYNTLNTVTPYNVASRNHVENLRSVIDNLPAIDSDVNANETDVRYSVVCDVVANNNEC